MAADTIIAVSSPAGNSFKGIVRLSGPRAFGLIQRTISKRIPAKNTWYSLATGININQLKIPARLFLMRAPRSYTREDVLEIHIPGSKVLLEAILQYFTSKGARLAQPGEFTRRAFLNGRLSLPQTEAVLDIIHSSSEQEHRLAVNQLNRHSFRQLLEINRRLLGLAAQIELALDFSDQDIEMIPPAEVKKTIDSILKDIRAVLQAGAKDKTVSNDGVLCVLCGRPNVGKSSLFNRLVKNRRNIVSPVPGTTRDYIEGRFSHKGTAFRIFDTAGIPADRLTGQQADRFQTDIYLFVIDALTGLTKRDQAILKRLAPEKIILVINKIDMQNPVSRNLYPASKFQPVRVSALTGRNIPALKDTLTTMVKSSPPERFAGQALINLRQQEDLKKCLGYLVQAQKACGLRHSYELITLDIRPALDRLNSCLGSFSAGKIIVANDILNNIFSRFCIGK